MPLPSDGVLFEPDYHRRTNVLGHPVTVTPAADNSIHIALSAFGFVAADAFLGEREARRLAYTLAEHYGLFEAYYADRVATASLPVVGDWATVTVDQPRSANLHTGQHVRVTARWDDADGEPLAEVLREGTSARWHVNARDHLAPASPPPGVSAELPPPIAPGMTAFMRGDSERPLGDALAAGDTVGVPAIGVATVAADWEDVGYTTVTGFVTDPPAPARRTVTTIPRRHRA